MLVVVVVVVVVVVLSLIMFEKSIAFLFADYFPVSKFANAGRVWLALLDCSNYTHMYSDGVASNDKRQKGLVCAINTDDVVSAAADIYGPLLKLQYSIISYKYNKNDTECVAFKSIGFWDRLN
uniref:ABC transmembrane type-2 domain-containing protein n=1 Tax=Glossina austeni TaxID=7395 RepID=A0A1A9VE22_GLOAU